jgi:hypothetical protein
MHDTKTSSSKSKPVLIQIGRGLTRKEPNFGALGLYKVDEVMF